jgi:RNA methyltransferase, TrmH family
MISTITSSNNSFIKEVKALKLKRHREEKKQFIIEGIRFVEEAFMEKSDIVRVFLSDQLSGTRGGKELQQKVVAGGYESYMLSEKLFREISDTETPQGILAILRMKSYELNDIITNNTFVIILDSLQDPGNLGTIIRTADAAGASGIILSKGCVDLYNPKVLRATMGSVFHVPFYFSLNLEETIDILKARGICTYAAHLNGDKHYFNLCLKDNIAIIIGNEANGISDEIASKADALVKIPMPGRSESLNASVAASLLMYEVVRQRMIEL